jgi:hypothetical protein
MKKFFLSSWFNAYRALLLLNDAVVMEDLLAIDLFRRNFPDHALPPKLGLNIKERESHLWYCLLQLEDDLNAVNSIASKARMPYIRRFIREASMQISELTESNNVIATLKRSSKESLYFREFPDGEIRPQYVERAKPISIPADKHLQPFTDYYKIIGKEFISRIQAHLQFEERISIGSGKFFESELDKYIMYGSWERFFKICDYYSTEKLHTNYDDFVLLHFNKENETYTFHSAKVAKGKSSLAPLLGQFIRYLYFEGMIVPGNSENMTQAFIEFFTLSKLKDGKKLVNKYSNDVRPEFEQIFKQLKKII